MESFNQWYQSNQVWTEPSIRDAADKMRHVYYNKNEGIAKGILLKENIEKNFDLPVIAEPMVRRIKEIIA